MNNIKRYISIVLSLVIVVSIMFCNGVFALADTMYSFYDFTNNKMYQYEVNEEEKSQSIYDFVSKKLGIPSTKISLSTGGFVQKSTTFNDVETNKIDIVIGSIWGEDNNYNKSWLENYDSKQEYHISSPSDMAALKHALMVDGKDFKGKNIYLDCDIDLSENLWLTKVIAPEDSTYFAGVFDGENHTIKGIRMTPFASFFASSAGLFPQIKNSVIKNLNTIGNITRANACFVGLMVGVAVNSAIYNCSATGSVDCYASNGTEACGYVGALGGTLDHCAVMNCFANANIVYDYDESCKYSSGNNVLNIGAFAGAVKAKAEDSYCLLNSYATGNIDAKATKLSRPQNVGGLVGSISDDVINCYSLVKIDCGKKYGELFGELSLQNDEGKAYLINNIYCKDTEKAFASNSIPNTVVATAIQAPSDLINKLNSGTALVDETITNHRDIIADSSWKELAEQCGAKDFSASKWFILSGLNNGYPTFHFEHKYGNNIVDGKYQYKKCIYCGEKTQKTLISQSKSNTSGNKENTVIEKSTAVKSSSKIKSSNMKTSPKTGYNSNILAICIVLFISTGVVLLSINKKKHLQYKKSV